MLLESVIKSGIGVVGRTSVEMGLDLDAVGLSVDEGRHGSGVERDPVVVEVFAVDALHHVAGVLLASGLDRGFKRPVSSLLGIGLIGPCKGVFRGDHWTAVCPITRPALPRGIKGVKTTVGQVISVPVAVVASPRSIPHHVGDVGDELGLLIEHDREPQASVEGGVGRVEVVVPKFVTRIVPVRRQIKHEGPSLSEALVGTLDELERGIDGVPRESGDEEKAVLASRERFHRFSSERPVVVVEPIISSDGSVVSAAKQGQFLVKTRLVVAARNAERHAFCRDEVIE